MLEVCKLASFMTTESEQLREQYDDQESSQGEEATHSLLKPGMLLREPPERSTLRPMKRGKGLVGGSSYRFSEGNCNKGFKLVNDSGSHLQGLSALSLPRATKATTQAFPKERSFRNGSKRGVTRPPGISYGLSAQSPGRFGWRIQCPKRMITPSSSPQTPE